ncbi:MAG TPA: proline iminopeptidase-family hydrolase [Acidimicrobiales bacterium]|nr:proline iminopeptidase-family hydrolase [Acidimicrobiales bacterium]
MIPAPTREGTVDFRGWTTWFRISGDLDRALTPLVVLHGGPGAAHNYTLAIAGLADEGRPVIHYDQLGCGNSTHLPDRGEQFWTVDLFVEELENLLSGLGVADDFHLLGQSWGGMLGAEFAVRRPRGLRSLVISNSPASMDLWVSEATRLRALMPEDVRNALDRHERDGTISDPEYLAATQAFYDRHVCRVLPNPPEVLRSMELVGEDATVYSTMNGPNEFYCIGTLRSWSIVERVSQIDVATLLASGRYDEATPATMQPFFDSIPDVRWEIFEESSHMPFVEQTDEYLRVVGAFLRDHD